MSHEELLITCKQKIAALGLLDPSQFTVLGDICKQREAELRTLDIIPATSHYIIRVDGRSFSKFTKAFAKPFDGLIVQAMTDAATAVCADLKCTFAYTESDEITFVFKSKPTDGYQHVFGGKVAKLLSTCAALTSVAFYKAISTACPALDLGMPHFDARLVDVIDRQLSDSRLMRAVVWRQNDAIRNSISMVAQSMFSHSQLQGVGSAAKLAMIEDYCGKTGAISWLQHSSRCTKGTFVYLKATEREFTPEELNAIPEHCRPDPGTRFVRTSQAITSRERLCTVPGVDYALVEHPEFLFDQTEVHATLTALNW